MSCTYSIAGLKMSEFIPKFILWSKYISNSHRCKHALFQFSWHPNIISRCAIFKYPCTQTERKKVSLWVMVVRVKIIWDVQTGNVTYMNNRNLYKLTDIWPCIWINRTYENMTGITMMLFNKYVMTFVQVMNIFIIMLTRKSVGVPLARFVKSHYLVLYDCTFPMFLFQVTWLTSTVVIIHVWTAWWSNI